MSLKKEIEEGSLAVNAEVSALYQHHDPVLMTIEIEGKEWPCVGWIQSNGAMRLRMSYAIQEDGRPLSQPVDPTTYPDLKQAVADGKDMEIRIREKEYIPTTQAHTAQIKTKVRDEVAFVAVPERVEDSMGRGQVWGRKVDFQVMGWREPLDFEPPEISLRDMGVK